MKIFDKRPLSLILCIMLGAFVVFQYLSIFSAILLIPLFIISFIKPLSKFINLNFARLAIALAAFSMLLSFLYFNLWFDASKRYTEEATITCTVEDIEPTEALKEVLVTTEDINDTAFSKYNLILYIDNSIYHGYSIGSKIQITGVIDSTSDNFTYYYSHGISGIVNEVTSCRVIETGTFTAEYKISSLRKELSRKIVYYSGEDVGGLLSALLLGEKEYLSNQIKLDFTRLGLSHILALSGMHLAILAIGFSKLLMCFGINKKISTIGTVLFTLLYMTITGFSVSVVRAGIMLIISSLLFLFAETRDSMTTLFMSVTIICIFTPYAIFDLSLWLSAFATLGIIVMSEWLGEKYNKPSFFKWLLTSFLASFFAISATSFITVLKFDGISLLAPFTTIVFSLLVQLFLYLGILLLMLGSFIPIRFIVIALGQVIIDFAVSLSNISWIYARSNFTSVKIFIILFSILFFSFMLFEIKQKKLYVSSLCVILTLIFTLSLSLTLARKSDDDIIYINGNTEIFMVTNNNKVGIVDIGNYNKNSGYSSSNTIINENLAQIDNYVFTNYSYQLKENLSALLGAIPVKNIYFPTPQNTDEIRILFEALSLIKKYRTTLNLYDNDEILYIGDVAVLSAYNSALGNEKENLVTILDGNNTFTYVTNSIFKSQIKNMALEFIAQSDTIIFGRHENSNYKFTYELPNLKALVISNDKIEIHTDTLEYYKNCNIYYNMQKLSLIH